MDLTAGDPEQAKGMGGPQAGERATQAGEEALWVCKTVCPELSPWNMRSVISLLP